MSVKLLTEHHFEFLSLKGGCTGSSESTLVKMSHCWKSHVAAHLIFHVKHMLVHIKYQATVVSKNMKKGVTNTSHICCTVKPVLSRHSKRTQKIVFQYRLLLNAGQKYCRMLQGEHSAILVTFIKLPLSIKTSVLSIIKWLFKTGFTVKFVVCCSLIGISRVAFIH